MAVSSPCSPGQFTSALATRSFSASRPSASSSVAYTRSAASSSSGVRVSEMITSRALVERTPESKRLITHHESESPRSIQLYSVDPATAAELQAQLDQVAIAIGPAAVRHAHDQY